MLNGVAVHARSAFNGVLGSGSLVVATQSSLVQRSGTSRWVVVIGVHPRREELPKGFFSPGASCEPHGLRWRAVGGHDFWAVTVCAVATKNSLEKKSSTTTQTGDRGERVRLEQACSASSNLVAGRKAWTRPCVGSCEVSMDALLTGYWPAASPNSHSWVTTVHWMSGCEQRRVC